MSPGASWQVSACLHRMSWLLHAKVAEAKFNRLRLAVKAGFDPNQPRVPAGSSDGGQWIGTGGGGSAGSGTLSASSGILTNIPRERPASARIRHAIIKELVKEAAILAVAGAGDGAVGVVLTALNVASWVHDYGPFIQSYIAPPRTLEELQDAVSTPTRGYDIHHIVEQTPAEQDGFPRSQINSRENLVRIPTGDQRHALLSLYDHPNLQVRLKAVKNSLALAPQEGRRVLQAIADSREYPQAGEAGMSISKS